jgi:hypothetical protein
MANTVNNNPAGNAGLSANLLPKFYQTTANKKFLQSTIDQLFQPGTLTKVTGYIGETNAKAAKNTDVYVTAATPARQHYQLEPGVVIQDSLNNVTFFKDYQDYVNQIKVFGGNTTNHARLNKQEFYSWDPHIDWDKFVNFQHYYWLPYGPQTITIVGQQKAITSTYNVSLQNEGTNNQYIFTPDGSTPNPTLKLFRGQTYTFNIVTPGNPFNFRTSRSLSPTTIYRDSSITSYSVTSGSITFTIPLNAPSLLYYQSDSDINLGGSIEIFDIKEDTFIDVTTDVLGKQTYTLPDGTSLSNGMKIAFAGNVTPVEYATGEYYVEGVGSAIKLIPTTILEVINPYTEDQLDEYGLSAFDSTPYSEAIAYASTKDYLVINRASRDHNPWSRYNRWFHQDVINVSASYNGDIPNLDQTARATRPIIEFEPDLKLFNFGTNAILDVDLIDTFTTDAFSTFEGIQVFNTKTGILKSHIDGIQISQGQRVIFTADTNSLIANNVYTVEFIDVDDTGNLQIHLVETLVPTIGQTVLITQGVTNQSMMYWFNGATWVLAQQKTTTNQPPLFDLVDSNGISFSDSTTFNGTTFKGTQLFSYKIGLGNADIALGFPLSYQNVTNIGDIVFNFNFATDTFQYKESTNIITVNASTGFLRSQDYLGNTVYVNGWQTCTSEHTQGVVRIFKNSNKTNNFNIDVFAESPSSFNLDQSNVRVYINSSRVAIDNWSLVKNIAYYTVVFKTPVALTDIVTIKIYPPVGSVLNNVGFYEIPLNLQNNPLNDTIGNFTLGEVIDHVNSIIDNIYNPPSVNDINGATYIGSFPGTSNLRDLGNITQYGTKFVQHSGPVSLSTYHITSETNNVVKAVQQAQDDYNNFKKEFITVASNLGIDSDPVTMVNLVLQKINTNKPNVAPYYFSDMVPYGANVTTDLTVVDGRIKTYPLSAVFTLDKLSNKAVNVYHTSSGVRTQLIYGRDYTFSNQGFVVITSNVILTVGDIITTKEYDSTDGCFVPETPTKLGIWPAYVPQIYTDTTLSSPQLMIQGHDGSQVLAYNDYRDALILELETRIFNNIKVQYNPSIFDINDIIPSYSRTTDYTLTEFNSVLSTNFYRWAALVGVDFTEQLNYDINNTFTYNYSENSGPNGTAIPGYWRGVYRWLLDTDRPNLCPWEMLGFSIEPNWWQSVYGPAPYTSDNLVLWNDLTKGIVREPGVPLVVKTGYVRPYLANHIPVDESGNLVSPLQSGLSTGTITPSIDFNFIFGDVGPVEASWRRSSYYPFSVLIATLLLKPANTIGVLFDRSRIVRNLAGQLVYSDTNLRVRPQDLVIPSSYSSSTRIQTAGIVNYIVDLIFNQIFSNNQKSYTSYQTDLQLMNVQLSYRLGAFTNQNQFSLLLESKTPASTGNVFVPAEDYTVFLNSSSPVKKITYSGIIITKLNDGFQVSGYSQTQPYFVFYPATQSGATINVGGISEAYSVWASNQIYNIGSIVQYQGSFYATITAHTSTTDFATNYFKSIPQLPVTGGQNATLRTAWDRSNPVVVPYGTEFNSIQSTFDFIIGYGEWLKDQGFGFDEFNENLQSVSNWDQSGREFLFWTTQNWSVGQDKWTDWSPDQPVLYGAVVRYNGSYYSSNYNLPPADAFDLTKYTLLPGLSNVGSSVISLSPAAKLLKFYSPLSVVDSVTNSFYQYEIFKVDGTPVDPVHLDSYRSGNTVSYTTTDNSSIYSATFHFIQHEHVIIMNNTTMFNDVIYNPPSGYRQQRIKVSGYVTTNWYGGLDIPGFIFDAAEINNWQAWQDYNMGDIVAFQGYYYSANEFLPGSSVFTSSNWTQLSNKPTSQILPNWTNIATQFTDFYSTDIDSFDSEQQAVAQHLIGYQKRQYLDNIIQDPVSEFKFYQGMIRDKGTQNVLNSLFNVLTSDSEESLTFYEEWAVRVGQYGANKAYDQIEFVIDNNLIKTNPQGYLLTQEHKADINSFVIQQTPSDVYSKPPVYESNPFPVLEYYNPLLRTAGYVNSGDVFISLKQLSNINDVDSSGNRLYPAITSFNNGVYVWTVFDAFPYAWNVYRYTDTGITVTGLSYTPGNLTITSSSLVPLQTGAWVGVNMNLPTTNTKNVINGFYQVSSVTLNSFVLSATITGFPTLVASDLTTITVYNFMPQRIGSIDDLDSLALTQLNPGELAWTDDAGDGKWATWKYNPAYISSNINFSNTITQLNRGRAMAVSKDGTVAAFSTADGQLSMYYKPFALTPWTEKQIIQAPNISETITSNVTQTYPTSGSIIDLTLSPVSTGSGYTPLSGSKNYYQVPLTGGSGTGAVANISVVNGHITSAQIVSGGVGYHTGNTLSVNSSDVGGTGSGFSISVLSINANQRNVLSTVLAISDDNKWFAVGSPSASNVVSKYKGTYNPSTTYHALDVVTDGLLPATYYQIPTGYISLLATSVIPPDPTNTVTIYFNTLSSAPFAVGSAITISGFETPGSGNTVSNTGYNGIFLVTDCTTSYVQYTNYDSSLTVPSITGTIIGINQNYSLAPTYTNVASATTESLASGAVFTINVISAGSYNVIIAQGGVGYKTGNVLIIPGTSIGGSDENYIQVTVTGVDAHGVGTIISISSSQPYPTYTNSSGTTVYVPNTNYIDVAPELSLGSNATFNVTTTLTGYNVTINNAGSGYFSGDVLKISGYNVGGTGVTPDSSNDIIIKVLTVSTDGNFSITSISSLGSVAWEKTLYIPVDPNGFNSSYTNQGVITLYQRDAVGNFELVDSILSPQPQNNEYFGSTLTFGNNSLFIGASGTNTVYTLNYSYITHATTAYNPVGSSGTTLVVTSTENIHPGMTVVGTGFASNQVVNAVLNLTTIIIDIAPDSTPSGLLSFVSNGWGYGTSNAGISGSNYGNNIDVSSDNSTLVISASAGTTNGQVLIYKNTGTGFNLSSPTQTITGTDTSFGQSIAVSDDGMYIAISDDMYSNTNPIVPRQGAVTVYSYADSQYSVYQHIVDHKPEQWGLFGNKLSFMNNSSTLVIYSKNGTTTTDTTLDDNKTTFDKESTRFITNNPVTGRVDVYDRYANNWVFGETLPTTNQEFDGYGNGFAVGSNQIFVGAPFYTVSSTQVGQIWNYTKSNGTYSWTIKNQQIAIPDITKVKKAFLYNKALGTLVTYLDVVDPLQGKIPGPADEEIKYKTYYDPAVYTTGNSSVNVDLGNSWGPSQVGTLWWNLSTAKFVNSYDSDVVYRTNTWNTLATGASIDIYEWVQTSYTPTQWDTLADTASGIAAGISGKSLYSNAAYSTTSFINTTTNTTVYTYYFWVKNKVIIPDVPGRHMSANDVASLIANPHGQDYTYLALTGTNSFSLTNASNYLVDANVVLSIEYWTIDKTDQNIHTQWKIISNDPNTTLPPAIEQKWIDSLCGVDSNGRSVPDRSFPPKLWYGVENRPRQSMFVNRFEALKCVIETVNQFMIQYDIAYSNNISSLESYDTPPTSESGLWNIEVATDADLAFISTYGQTNYRVLVNSDSQANGNWSVYLYDTTTSSWNRTLTQTYDVRKYWSYVDWYSTGYSQFTSADYLVNTFVDLNSITPSIGELVKVLSGNSGGWLLLEKYANSTSVDWTQTYKIVGIQNGTIQFSTSLYEMIGSNEGLDSDIFDGIGYDNSSSVELRIILNTIKNNIFVGNTTFVQAYLNLFFDSVRYAFSEQIYVDWIFKTSFVKARHNVGSLNQPVTYPVDNLSNFEDYVNEVKPYRTKVREYIDDYTSLDPASLPITDFDLQPIYENGKITFIQTTVSDGKIVAGDSAIQTYPWKFWLDNVGFSVTELILVSGGSGYVSEPTVVITSDSGSGATAQVFYYNGSVNRIVLMTPGSGYLSAPTVTIEGGLNSTGVPARAVAIIGDSVVRSNSVELAFDRITTSVYNTQLQKVQTFTGNGKQLQFNLTWAPDIRVNQSKVTVNGIPVLRELYTLSTVAKKISGYTQYTGNLNFVAGSAPTGTIVVTYLIDIARLNAIDRINYYYNPTSGMLGKDFAQLMTGIDYGGVVVNGLGFNIASGWGSAPFSTGSWDNFDSNFDDYNITVAAGTYTFPVNGIAFPSTWTPGTNVNIYYIESHTDSYDNSTGTYNDVLSFNYSIFAEPVTATIVTTVHTTSVTALYQSSGSYSTTLTVDNATGIQAGMAVTGNGFAGNQTVLSVNGNTLTLSAAPNSTPANGETLAFNFNYAGSYILKLTSTENIHLGDVVTCSTPDTIVYGTTVTKIIDSYRVEISSIVYAYIPLGTGVSFTRTLIQPIDVNISSGGVATLTSSLPEGTILNLTGYLNPVRLDAPDYTEMSGSPTNPDAIIETPVVGSSPFTFTLPVGVNGFTVSDGDQFIIRKSTSDGSSIPSNIDYDTSLSGGTTANASGVYSTATGLAVDDINIDGDGFVTENTSPAPEEVVPGQVVDAVAIKVFDRPYVGSSAIKVDNFIGDGTKFVYILSQQPNSNRAIIVKENGVIKTYGTDYSIDYRLKSVIFNSVPAVGTQITIYSIGFNGANLLDLDYFVSDGTTTEFITTAEWQSTLTSLVYVDGVVSTPVLFKTDSTYATANVVGIRFSVAPSFNALINYIIVSGNQKTFSVTSTQTISTNGGTTYSLTYPLGVSLPYETSTIVRVDNTILSAPINSYFTIEDNQLVYSVDSERAEPFTIPISNIVVIANGVILTVQKDYTVDLSGISVTINELVYKKYVGDELIISITTENGYTYDATTNQITFSQAYDNTHVVEVISSYDHTYLDIERTEVTVGSTITSAANSIKYFEYKQITSGLITLDRPVIDTNYVWVIKNNTLLTPTIEYKLNDDHITVQLAIPPVTGDKISILTFGNNILQSGIAYMQFKDMLNRVSYKRLNANKQTKLAQDLHWNDTTIAVVDASQLDIPNLTNNNYIPGVVEIRGERIEYFTKVGNVLGQLRRGTLGTGIYNLNKAGTNVQGIGASETIPYKDTVTSQTITSLGGNSVTIDFVPTDVNALEIFVGGYDNSGIWLPNTPYVAGTNVIVGQYTYRCTEDHTSSTTFAEDSSYWHFFVGNIRLKKGVWHNGALDPYYYVFNVNNAPYSPAGDVKFSADFSIDKVNPVITLTNPLTLGTQVTVVTTTGQVWDSNVNILYDNSIIAEFIKAVPGIWYSGYKTTT